MLAKELDLALFSSLNGMPCACQNIDFSAGHDHINCVSDFQLHSSSVRFGDRIDAGAFTCP